MPNENIAAVRAFITAINRHDPAGLAALMTADHAFVDSRGAVHAGREAMTAEWREYFRLFPDYRIQADAILGDGAVLAVFGTATGTYHGIRGPVPENRVAMPAAWKAVIDDGRIKLWQVYADWTEGSKIIEADAKSGQSTA